MKLHTQRDLLAATLADVDALAGMAQLNISRKIAAPYGDGSHSNMVNAETDILPHLTAMRSRITMALDNVS